MFLNVNTLKIGLPMRFFDVSTPSKLQMWLQMFYTSVTLILRIPKPFTGIRLQMLQM